MNNNGHLPHNGHSLSTCDRPRPRKGIYFIERLVKLESRKFLCYSPCLQGFRTHYTKAEGTTPCYADHSMCIPKHDEETLREYFLFHAWCPKKKRQVFVYLTPGAFDQVQMQIPENATLRGRMITVSRTDADNGRLNVQVGEVFYNNGQTLPEEADPYLSIHNWMRIPLPDQTKHPKLAGGGEEMPT